MYHLVKLLPKCYLLCAALLFIGFSAKAQTSKIDDLLAQLKQSDTDTAQISVLKKLSAAYTSVDPVKKFYYANQYLKLSEKNNIDSNVANAYIDMGMSYVLRSILDTGLYYFKLGHDKAKAVSYQNGMGRSLVNIGYTNDRLERKQESVKNYEESLKIFRRTNNKRGINHCIMNLGSLYFDLGEYKTADIYFRQVYNNVKDNPNDQAGLASALFSLGSSNRKMGSTQQALEFYHKSLAIREKLGDLNGIALSNWGIGVVLNSIKQYPKALSHLEIALQNNIKTKNIYQEAIVLMSISDSYLHLNDYKQAEINANLALEKANEAKAKGIVVQALEYLVRIEKAQEKYEEAFKHQTEHIAINDSLNDIKIKKDVILNDLKRVNTDNKNLTERNQSIIDKISDYTTTIAAITILLAVLAVLLFFYYKRNAERKAANLLLTQQKVQIAEANEELSALNEELKTQMDIVSLQNTELEKLNNIKNKFFSIVSHDLRGPINSLKTLFDMYHSGILTEKELGNLLERLEGTVYNTASFLDDLLEWSKSQLEGMVVNPVEVDLHQVVAHNIKLMESQIKQKSIIVENNIESGTNVFADLNMVNVVIRNLLSNAIKFCSPKDHVVFNARLEAGKITCIISDTGPGISELDQKNLFNLTHTSSTGTAGEKGHHIGLVLCRDMVLQNNGTLQMESKLGQGTTFYITLPKAI